MASLAGLLLFCDFLENRLHTLSLSLLRRMLTDFYAGNEHTLLDFMRLGASVVYVMPMERTCPRHLQEAERLLAEHKEDTGNIRNDQEMSTQMDTNRQDQTQMDPPGSQQLRLCVFRFLSARVATKNILWLRDMFQEFCKGEDAMLRAFVLRGNEPISVIPVDIQALCMAPLPPPPLIAETVATDASTVRSSEVTPSPTLSPHRKRSREGEREQQGASGEMETAGSAVDRLTRKQYRMTLVPPQEKEAEITAIVGPTPESLSADEIRKSIMSALERVEEREPWNYAFKLETLLMPFSRVRYPKLAAALQEFWENHARAVWERKFWSPFSRSRTHKLHNQRRCRQSKAQTFFEKRVLIPVYKELGAAFFVEMDHHAIPSSGWYYLGQAVDLFTLAQRCSLHTCLQYMESEACKRFPVVPGVSRNFFSRVNGKSQSMWSSSSALKPILNDIVALKAKTNDNS